MEKKSSNVKYNMEELEPQILQFKEKFTKEVLEAEVYDLDQVINLDETSISRDAPSETTFEQKGTKKVQIQTNGSEKTHYTVVLASTYTGGKLPAMLIWPSKGKKNVNSPLPDNLYIDYREKSWMDKELMLKWVKTILAKRQRKIKENRKGLLILDGFRAHLHPDVKALVSSLNFDFWVLPPNTTPFLQPLDISVNRAFKSNYHRLWDQWMEKKVGLNLKPSKDRIIEWTSAAWELISGGTVMNGWNPYREHRTESRGDKNFTLTYCELCDLGSQESFDFDTEDEGEDEDGNEDEENSDSTEKSRLHVYLDDEIIFKNENSM